RMSLLQAGVRARVLWVRQEGEPARKRRVTGLFRGVDMYESQGRAAAISRIHQGFLGFLLLACLALPQLARAQFPSPTYGWNLGNTLEANPTEGSWGPAATQALINAVADNGFNVIRIP